MSVHPDFGSLAAAALVAQMGHDLLHAGVDRLRGHEGFVLDDPFPALLGVHREHLVAVPQVVDKCNSRNAKHRHFGRNNKSSHDVVPRAGLVDFVARNQGMHGTQTYTSGDHEMSCGESQYVTEHGYQIGNTHSRVARFDCADSPEASPPTSSGTLSSRIAAVNGGHAPTDDAVPSGDKSTALNPQLFDAREGRGMQ